MPATIETPAIVWFRLDLRMQDNPALNAAIARGGPVVPVYILDDAGEGGWPLGGASRWWLHHSLAALDSALHERGSRLVLARGEAGPVIERLARELGAGAVYWNRRYEPAIIARDARIKSALLEHGIEARSFNGSLLHEPHAVANKQGGPFQVFTPFWRHCLARPVAEPEKLTAKVLRPPGRWPEACELQKLKLRPAIPWDAGLRETWQPGEHGAHRRMKKFIGTRMAGYGDARNRPDQDGTSMLSPWLHFGEISPRQIWAAVRAEGRDTGVFPPGRGASVLLTEIGWREFAYHLLYHFPETPRQPLRAEFARFPWADAGDGANLRAWQQGRTGYPIVDAGMRQLWRTGWMHNRVRMVAASFLVKHLRLPWQHGAEWFWDTLVDADLANNTLGWQWTAGCGADAAPYFRVFAPVLQGRKFDPAGEYVRRWVPELAALDAKNIHAPWEASPDELARAGVILGETYPRPIVDHASARAAALAAYQTLRKK